MKYLKLIIFFIIVGVLSSCGAKKKVVKKVMKKEPITIDYKKFPQQNLMLRDIHFVGYVNPKIFLKSEIFKDNYKLVEKILPELVMKHLGAFKPFYFTLSDFQKREELLFFFDYSLDFLLKDNFQKRKIEGDELVIFSKTNNQEFGYIKYKNNNSIYGDITLIQELYNISKKTVPMISNERYNKFNLSFNIDNLESSLIKILWVPFEDDFKLLNKIAKKQPLFKELLTKLDKVYIDVRLKNKKLNIKIEIYSSENGVGKVSNLMNKEISLLVNKLDKKDIEMSEKDISMSKTFFNSLKIKKDNNKLIIEFSAEEKVLMDVISFLFNKSKQ